MLKIHKETWRCLESEIARNSSLSRRFMKIYIVMITTLRVNLILRNKFECSLTYGQTNLISLTAVGTNRGSSDTPKVGAGTLRCQRAFTTAERSTNGRSGESAVLLDIPPLIFRTPLCSNPLTNFIRFHAPFLHLP